MEALLLSKEVIQCLEAHFLGTLASPIELSETLEGSLQFMNIPEHPTQFYVQAYVQEYTRDFWNSLESLRLFSCLLP